MAATPIRVFCSHTTADDAAVDAFTARLAADGFETFNDAWSIMAGDDFVAKVREGLENADAGLIFLSAAALGSKWVSYEISVLLNRAINEGLRLIPVLLESELKVPAPLGPFAHVVVDDYAAILSALRSDPGAAGAAAFLGSSTSSGRALSHTAIVRLDQDDNGLRVELEVDGAIAAKESGVVAPTTLFRSYHDFVRFVSPPAATGFTREFAQLGNSKLAELGASLGKVVFPGDVATELSAAMGRSQAGDSWDVVIEASGQLIGFPFEAAHLNGSEPIALKHGVTVSRRVAGLAPQPVPAQPGPLKILVAVGAPDEGTTNTTQLHVEREWNDIVAALGGARGVAPENLTLLESTTPADIRDALARNQYHVLHVTGHGSPATAAAEATIELADEDGEAVKVTMTELAGAIADSGKRLPLVVLSSCRSGLAAGDATSLAVGLLEAGVAQVIAMQTAVTHDYAVELAARFYENLADETLPWLDAPGALALARRHVETERRARAGKQDQPYIAEFATPTLFAGAAGVLIDVGPPAVTLKRSEPAPAGGIIPELELAQVIGRRSYIRHAVRVLTRHRHAQQEHGFTHGAVLTGMGGTGKTTIAGRAVKRLRDAGWAVAGLKGRFTIEGLVASVAEALPERRAVLEATVEDVHKVSVLQQIFATDQVVVVLDDFEENLETGKPTFTDETVQQILRGLVQSCQAASMLITSRYPPDGLELVEISVHPLTKSERRRMAWTLPRLAMLSGAELGDLLNVIGGHPRLLELADAALQAQGTGHSATINEKIKELVQEHGVAIGGAEDMPAAVQQAIDLGALDIILDEIVDSLDPTAREVLLQVAVNNLPITTDELSESLEADLTAAQLAEVVRSLVDSSLVDTPGRDALWVHRWTAEGLRRRSDSIEHADRCHRAAAMRMAPDADGRVDAIDAEEAIRLLLQSGASDEAVAIAVGLVRFHISTHETIRGVLLADEVLSTTGVTDQAGALLTEAAANGYLQLGLLTRALHHFEAIHQHFAERAAADPTNTGWQRDLSVSHNKLGDLARAQGDLNAATTHYQHALTIREALAAADPTNTQWQRDLSVSHEKLGDLARAQGDLNAATTHYQHDLTIREALAAADPTNTQWQRDLSISHEKLGDLARAQGDLNAATTHYQHDLTIREALAAADPTNTQWQRDLSISHEKLGDLARAQGDLNAATTHYQHDLTIAEALAAADPTNTQWQRDLSISHEKLGDLARAQGDLNAATTHYQHAHAIASETQGAADVAATCLAKLGAIFLETDRPSEAIQPALKALAQRQTHGLEGGIIDLRILESARTKLGDDEFRSAAGDLLGDDQVIDLIAALDDLPAEAPASTTDNSPAAEGAS